MAGRYYIIRKYTRGHVARFKVESANTPLQICREPASGLLVCTFNFVSSVHLFPPDFVHSRHRRDEFVSLKLLILEARVTLAFRISTSNRNLERLIFQTL